MKISKLFHWLYAILMLLPFAFFVPSVLYYAFNDNATMQSVEVPKTETISVDFNQKIVLKDTSDTTNYLYSTYDENTLEFSWRSSTWVDGYYTLANIEVGHKYIVRVNGFTYFGFQGLADTYLRQGYNGTVLYTFNSADSDFSSLFTASNNTLGIRIGGVGTGVPTTDFLVGNFNLFDLTQMFGSGNEPTISQFNEWFPNDYYPYTESELMQITYNTGETEQLVENTSIINYAWESIWDLPLFSWTKVSFVATPFTYITGLFGLAASNSFNYVFTYFASMSIIWLVFDVIMYVPLLVHRWLDKGIVE